MARDLTQLQKNFVEHYLQCWNATEACRRAGYSSKSYASLRAQGSENLTKPNIRAEIDRRFKDVVMQSNEVLARLSYLARGFDPADYLELVEVEQMDADGVRFTSSLQVKLDIERLREDGYGRLIKSVRNTSNGPVYDFMDVLKPLELVGTNQGLFKRQVEHTGKDGGPIELTPISMEEWRKLRKERLDALGPGDTPEAPNRKG